MVRSVSQLARIAIISYQQAALLLGPRVIPKLSLLRRATTPTPKCFSPRPCSKQTLVAPQTEAGGFEPPMGFPPRQFSKLVPSTTQPRLHCFAILYRKLQIVKLQIG